MHQHIERKSCYTLVSKMSNDENGSNDEGGSSSTGQEATKAPPTNTDKKSSPQQETTDSDLVQMDGVQTAEESSKSTPSAISINSTTTMSSSLDAEVPSSDASKTENDTVISRTISDSSSTDVSSNCLVKAEERTAMEEERSPQASALETVVVDNSLTPGSGVASVSLNSEKASLPESESSTSNSSLKDSTREASSAKAAGPKVTFKVIFMGKKHEVEMPLASTILELKRHLGTVIDVPPSLQKIMIKGLASDSKTLADLGVTRTSKVLVVGSKFDDVVGINMDKPSARGAESTTVTTTKAEPLCTQKLHKKVLDKGPPEDLHPGVKGVKEPLPPHPLSGMLNKSGDKVRLTFKLELDQIWIGTRQRTEKVNMGSIRTIVSEPIEEKEQYHIMGLQLGTTEASRYWIYWVPAQYVDAIKSTVMGGSNW